VGLIRLFLALVVMIDHLRVMVMAPGHISADHYIAKGGTWLERRICCYAFLHNQRLFNQLRISEQVHRDGRISKFYKTRLIRIFLLYLPLLILISVFMGGIHGGYFLEKMCGIFLFGSDWFVSFGNSLTRICLLSPPILIRPGRSAPS
jgi:hypothetical protein